MKNMKDDELEKLGINVVRRGVTKKPAAAIAAVHDASRHVGEGEKAEDSEKKSHDDKGADASEATEDAEPQPKNKRKKGKSASATEDPNIAEPKKKAKRNAVSKKPAIVQPPTVEANVRYKE